MSNAWRNERIASFQISCQGKAHTIHVLRSGGLQLAHHDCDYGAWLIDDLRELALLPPENQCVALWRAWRAALKDGKELEPDFLECSYKEYEEMRKEAKRKHKARPVSAKEQRENAQRAFEYAQQLREVTQARAHADPLLFSPHVRWTRRGFRAARASLEMAEYDNGFERVIYTVKQGANISGKITWGDGKLGLMSGLISEIEIAIDPIRWMHRVYFGGIAVVEGMFVLDVLARRRDGARLVVAGRPSAKLGVYPADGLIDPTGRRIHWLFSEFWREWIVDEKKARA